MDLFMQLSNTLCSFFLRNFHSVFCLFAMSDLPAKMQKSYAGAVANAIQFWRLFQGIGRKSSPAPSNGKKRYKNDTSPEVSFLGMFHTLCAGHAYAKNHCCILHRRGRTRYHLLHGEKKRCSHCDCDVGGGKQEPAKRCRRCGERTGVRASRDVSKQRLSKKPIFPF